MNLVSTCNSANYKVRCNIIYCEHKHKHNGVNMAILFAGISKDLSALASVANICRFANMQFCLLYLQGFECTCESANFCRFVNQASPKIFS